MIPCELAVSVGSCRTFSQGLHRRGTSVEEKDGRVQKRFPGQAGGKFSKEEFARVKEYMERRDRGTAPTDEAPVETALAPSARIGMFMPSSAPELRGRKNLAMFLEVLYMG